MAKIFDTKEVVWFNFLVNLMCSYGCTDCVIDRMISNNKKEYRDDYTCSDWLVDHKHIYELMDLVDNFFEKNVKGTYLADFLKNIDDESYSFADGLVFKNGEAIKPCNIYPFNKSECDSDCAKCWGMRLLTEGL